MTLCITDSEFKLLRDLIEKECGIYLTENKTYLIETRLSRLVKESRCASFGEFYLKARSSPEAIRLCGMMIDAIATNETSWFRDRYPYQVLGEYLLPEYFKKIKAGRQNQIRIWSAGCSTGQEPYSIALTVYDFFRASSNESVCHKWVDILATDVSHASISRAMEARYDDVSINRGMPQTYRDRHFRKEGSSWVLEQRIRKMVTFKHCNLKFPLTGIGPLDIVFLRNVLIYFADNLKREIFEQLARVLSPGGCLFLGTGETVGGYSTMFDLIEIDGSLFYRLKPQGKT